MDTVILAAGRGSRLEGIAAPYYKPLLIINGQPLIRQCVERASEVTDGRIVIVAAPENAAPMSQVLYDAGFCDIDIILQRKPHGPGDALRSGLKLVTSDECLVLMGDNVSTGGDVRRVVTMGGNTVGVSLVDERQAGRFTRRRNNGSWVEKIPVTVEDLDEQGMVQCWVGPVKMNVREISQAIEYHDMRSKDDEIPIGPFFNALSHVTTVPVTTIDIGIPEALS